MTLRGSERHPVSVCDRRCRRGGGSGDRRNGSQARGGADRPEGPAHRGDRLRHHAHADGGRARAVHGSGAQHRPVPGARHDRQVPRRPRPVRRLAVPRRAVQGRARATRCTRSRRSGISSGTPRSRRRSSAYASASCFARSNSSSVIAPAFCNSWRWAISSAARTRRRRRSGRGAPSFSPRKVRLPARRHAAGRRAEPGIGKLPQRLPAEHEDPERQQPAEEQDPPPGAKRMRRAPEHEQEKHNPEHRPRKLRPLVERRRNPACARRSPHAWDRRAPRRGR